tara:strand:- start:2 stop:793 length:792 start_codon:yes stop_codon:yes gene_type:complete
MARGRTSPFAKGEGGKFVTLIIEAEARQAHEEMQKLAKETEKLKNKTKEASSATDANTSSTDKNTNSTKRNTGANRDNITSGFTKAIMLQTMTSAINQATGATYKMIAGLEANGVVDAERARQLQENARRAELLTGALEFMLSIQTVVTTVTEVNTAAKVKNAKATEAQTVAQTNLNKAILANPYVRLAAVLVGVAYSLHVIEKETGKVSASIEALNNALERTVKFFIELGGIADNNPIKRLVESSSMKKLNDMTRLEVLGVG